MILLVPSSPMNCAILRHLVTVFGACLSHLGTKSNLAVGKTLEAESARFAVLCFAIAVPFSGHFLNANDVEGVQQRREPFIIGDGNTSRSHEDELRMRHGIRVAARSNQHERTKATAQTFSNMIQVHNTNLRATKAMSSCLTQNTFPFSLNALLETSASKRNGVSAFAKSFPTACTRSVSFPLNWRNANVLRFARAP